MKMVTRTSVHSIHGLPSLGGIIRFVNGGVTVLPPMQYTNLSDYPMIVCGSISTDTENELGNTIMYCPSFNVIQPHETISINHKFFQSRDEYAGSTVIRKSINIIMTGIQFEFNDSCKCDHETAQMIHADNIVNQDAPEVESDTPEVELDTPPVESDAPQVESDAPQVDPSTGLKRSRRSRRK